MEVLINTADILFVLGYFTMDMLRLRPLAVVATSCLALYFWSQPEPLLNVVAWNLFFIGLNLVQLARLPHAKWKVRRYAARVRTGLRNSAQIMPHWVPDRTREPTT